MTIKRYQVVYGRYSMEFHEDANGPFVGYADHEHALAEKQAEMENALTEQRRHLGAMHDATDKELKRVRQVALEEINKLTQQMKDQARELERLQGELDTAERALRSKGYRKDCDIAACNCGPQWTHGGHASERLREIADALPYANGKTILERIEDLVALATPAATALQQAKEEHGK